MKKALWGLILLPIIGLVIFYFWGSASTLNPNFHDNYKRYPARRIPEKDTLTVMTYNLGYLSGMTNNRATEREESLFQQNLDRAIATISVLHPDILALQEVDFVADRSFYVNQMDSIGFGAGYLNGFMSVNWDKRYVPFPYWPPKYHFKNVISGQVIYSDYELGAMNRLELRKPNKSFVYNAFNIKRLVQFSDTYIGPHPIKIMNVHMEAFDKETRIAQAQIIKRVYERYADRVPVLLLGDFNSQPAWEEEGNEAMKIIMSAKNIASAISEEQYRANPQSNYTFSSVEPNYKIDHILYNENYLKSLEARVVTEMGDVSDHLPVYMKFVMHKKNEWVRPSGN